MKKEIIEKIKFMEMSLEQGEKLNFLCRPSYDFWGGFTGLETFFMSENMTENAITNDNNYYVILNYRQLENKKHEIKDYINSFCKYSLDDILGSKECTCKLPSKEEGEEWWYNTLLKNIEERSKFIKEKIKA